MGVGGDQLGLAGAGGGIDDGIGRVQAMLDGQVPGGEGNRFVKRDHAPVDRLGDETFGKGTTALLGQMFVDLAEHDGGQENGTIAFQVVGKGGGAGVLGEVLEPAG